MYSIIRYRDKRSLSDNLFIHIRLTLIPTSVTIYRSRHLKAKFLKKSFNNTKLKKQLILKQFVVF
jgi:hypothetical protein